MERGTFCELKPFLLGPSPLRGPFNNRSGPMFRHVDLNGGKAAEDADCEVIMEDVASGRGWIHGGALDASHGPDPSGALLLSVMHARRG